MDVRLRRVADGVFAIVLDRPAKLNALTLAMLDEIAAAAGRAGERGARALVVRSSSPRAFSAGADTEEWKRLDPAGSFAASARGVAALERLARMPFPLIAEIRGHCLGGGLELALACDLRVADPTARLGFPEVTLGSGTGWGGMPRLLATVGPARAKQLLLTGVALEADEAERAGLLAAVVPAAELRAHASALAGRIAACPPAAVSAIKQGIDLFGEPPAAAMRLQPAMSAVSAATAAAAQPEQSSGPGR